MQTTSIEHHPVIVTVPESTVLRYLEASAEVEQMLGLSPGPEFLMGLAVEHEDPFELSNTFLGKIIAHFGKR
jgi:hypothetical protein